MRGSSVGKIHGDGRKFLERFKSYFGSQISSQSLNEVYIYQLQPKSATKGDFFFIYFCLWFFRVGVTDCKWRTKPTKCCWVSGLVKQATAIKNDGKCREKIALWERWVVSTIVLLKSALRKRSRCYWETRSNVKGQHAPTRTDNQRHKYMKKIAFCCGFWL